MRSQRPKVLHELCGRPMVLWPVRAALEAGAGRVVVVDSPARELERVLPAGVELAVQPEPNGTGGAVIAAMSQLESAPRMDSEARSAEQPPGAPTGAQGPVLILSGDVPLVSAEAISGLMQAH